MTKSYCRAHQHRARARERERERERERVRKGLLDFVRERGRESFGNVGIRIAVRLPQKYIYKMT